MDDEEIVKVVYYYKNQTLQVETNRDIADRSLDVILERPIETTNQSTKSESLIKDPTREELVEFIKSQPNYEFSIESITQHLFGDSIVVMDSAEKTRVSNLIRSKTSRVRENIQKMENGEWTTRRDGRIKVYSFKKNMIKNDSVDEAELSTQEHEKEQPTAESY